MSLCPGMTLIHTISTTSGFPPDGHPTEHGSSKSVSGQRWFYHPISVETLNDWTAREMMLIVVVVVIIYMHAHCTYLHGRTITIVVLFSSSSSSLSQYC